MTAYYRMNEFLSVDKQNFVSGHEIIQFHELEVVL